MYHFESPKTINWDFELGKWRRKWRNVNAGLSAAASPTHVLCSFLASGVRRPGTRITPRVCKKEQSAAASLTMGTDSQKAELPTRLLGPKPGRNSEFGTARKALLPVIFTVLNQLKTSARSNRNLGLTSLRVTEQPWPIFSSAGVDGEKLDNILLFQTSASLSRAQKIKGEKSCCFFLKAKKWKQFSWYFEQISWFLEIHYGKNKII